MRNPDDEHKSKGRDPDIANAEAALRRAALKARERARRAGLKIPVYRNGQVVEEWPDEVRELAGAWQNFPDLKTIRKTEGKDIAREPL
jgi:hypothetical protein